MISDKRTFGEIDIVARHYDNKARSKLADRGDSVKYIAYSYHDEKDVYMFLNSKLRSQHSPEMLLG
jgi:hypothetical protein